ncbi:hypothetical protein YC2023_114585 [Brassica napus]
MMRTPNLSKGKDIDSGFLKETRALNYYCKHVSNPTVKMLTEIRDGSNQHESGNALTTQPRVQTTVKEKHVVEITPSCSRHANRQRRHGKPPAHRDQTSRSQPPQLHGIHHHCQSTNSRRASIKLF